IYGGVFGNGLTSVTVRADDRGRASARFYAAAGMSGLGMVEAASPEAKGVASFLIDVSAKK
ncbi:MAG: hypothetical protein AAGL98_16685, partial [Planctomycetota bacterium]